MFKNALLDGMVWSVLWIAYVDMLLKCFPWEMVPENPKVYDLVITNKRKKSIIHAPYA